ncbi:hypothetical protein AGLY_007142 [Aphis glycines]|uniref:Uncharacterized protein n=1 Tax=Aphis glycines TaxID=307491 RepID=A0A6G0TNT0_APHGL|nr:hypothetical protein AGLY_007142 [Aphis glycines]
MPYYCYSLIFKILLTTNKKLLSDINYIGKKAAYNFKLYVKEYNFKMPKNPDVGLLTTIWIPTAVMFKNNKNVDKFSINSYYILTFSIKAGQSEWCFDISCCLLLYLISQTVYLKTIKSIKQHKLIARPRRSVFWMYHEQHMWKTCTKISTITLVNFHNILVDSVQNHQFDISQSFEQYHGLSKCNGHVSNHTTSLQLVRLSLNDLGCHPILYRLRPTGCCRLQNNKKCQME